jgi:hypothetical protein
MDSIRAALCRPNEIVFYGFIACMVFLMLFAPLFAAPVAVIVGVIAGELDAANRVEAAIRAMEDDGK